MFIASLALSDFGFAVFSVVVLGTTTLASREWPFSWTTCQYQGFIAIVMAAASIETLGCTAVNRYCLNYERIILNCRRSNTGEMID